jgi:hypothetical protein
VYLFTPSAFPFDGITSIPFALIDYNFLGVWSTPVLSNLLTSNFALLCHCALLPCLASCNEEIFSSSLHDCIFIQSPCQRSLLRLPVLPLKNIMLLSTRCLKLSFTSFRALANAILQKKGQMAYDPSWGVGSKFTADRCVKDELLAGRLRG